MSTETPCCPQCNARLLPDPDSNALWCQFCGIELDDPAARAAAAALRTNSPHLTSDYKPPGATWNLDPDLLRALNDIWRTIQQGELADARFTIRRMQARFPDNADLWYLYALATTDPDHKRACLLRALEEQPYHEYAWREQGIMDGVIPSGDASASPPSDLDEATPALDVRATSETQACPLCSGYISYNAAVAALVCGHCSYQPESGDVRALVGPPPAYGYRDLDVALLQRRFGFSREWDIGSRVLTCQNCGAQLTLSDELAALCPFCDSAHVLLEDAAGSFEQPDALVPFKLDRTRAARALDRRLPPTLRPQIVRGEMWGVYLPFWAFEGSVAISLPLGSLHVAMLRPGLYNVYDVLVGGVERPSQAVLYELMPYDLHALARYDRRYLARWSAQVYRTDVIQASLTARAFLKHMARGLATAHLQAPPEAELARTDSDAYNPPDTALWRAAAVDVAAIRYRLILLPVWMVTLILVDGTRQPAVVNGQTGEAILSASFDRDSIIAGPNRAQVKPLPVLTPARPRRNVIRPISPPPERKR